MIQHTTAHVRVLAAALAMSCASCGGGGGGPSPPPPPPPASVVVANASASAATVHEGQPFSVDASASTTTNGAPLTFAWTQVSGPAVTIANPNTAKLDLSASEVTADSPAQFRVTVTAGGATAQATANITFSNIAQTPSYGTSQTFATVTVSTPVRKVFGGDLHLGLAGYAANATDPLTFLDFSLSPSSEVQVSASQLGSLPQDAIMRMSSLYIAPAIADQQFTVAEEAADRVRVFTRHSSAAITTRATLTLTDPCGISTTSLSGNALFIGQRAAFSFVLGGTGPIFIDKTVSTGRPFCALVAPGSRLTGFALNLPSPVYPHVIALDAGTNELIVYTPSNLGAAAVYTAQQITPVQLNASKPLTLATWAPIGAVGLGSPSGMALVFTDGAHNGEHRLVIVGFDAARTLVQEPIRSALACPSKSSATTSMATCAIPKSSWSNRHRRRRRSLSHRQAR
ncbi:MAG: hypothetical protein EON61_14210 [Alphaproteobacteria bacterium]|nr:MAG: hypothetical protein EON61_14210 [Alphaproteobacteria bacterium]